MPGKAIIVPNMVASIICNKLTMRPSIGYTTLINLKGQSSVKHLGQLLILTCEEPQVPPSVLAAMRLGHIGGVVLNAPNVPTPKALQELVWLLRESASLGNQPSPFIILDPAASLSSLWPLPSWRSMAVSGLTDDVHRLLNTLTLIWRQLGITGVMGPRIGLNDFPLGPWTDKQSKYLQLWIRDLRQGGLTPFNRFAYSPLSPEATDVLTATIDSGLGAAVISSDTAHSATIWRDHLDFRGILVHDLSSGKFHPDDVSTGIQNGCDNILLPAQAPLDASYRTLLTAMNYRKISKRKLYAALSRVRTLKEGQHPLPWNPSIAQRPIDKWAQNIWNHAVVHTGAPYAAKHEWKKLALLEFGQPSPLQSLKHEGLAFYRCLDLDPDVRDLLQIQLQVQKNAWQLIIHLNDASHHLNQSLLFPLCQPRPIGIAMTHPSDLFLLPPDATGLTNFDTHIGAYQAVWGAIAGQVLIRGRWPHPQKVMP